MDEEAVISKRRGIQTGFISVIVGISLVLLMLGLVIGAYLGLENLQRSAKENIEIDIFFSPNLNNADIKLIEQELKDWEAIKSIWFVSPDRALEVFIEDQNEVSEIKAIYGDKSPFPPSLTFHPKNEFANKTELENLSNEILKKFPNRVTDVSYDTNRVNEVNLGFLQWVYLFIAIGVLLAVIAFAMINNTIRLALYSKRFIIKTMQLVGAKSSFIRAPFLYNAILQGFISSVIGMALLLGVFYTLNKYMDLIHLTFDIESFVLLFLSLLLIGIVISLLSTWFALNRYLRKKLDSLY